jgi:tetratricopeptide (TPR) repeat protein
MKSLPRVRISEPFFLCAFVLALLCASCRKAEVRTPNEWNHERALCDLKINSFIDSGRFEEARTMSDSLIAAGQGDSRVLGQRARALEGLGMSTEAIAAYEEAILKDYENCENHLHFATYLMRIGKTGRAQTEFMEAKLFCEERYLPLIYRNMAVADIKLDKRELARQYVDEGLRIDPDDPYLCGLKGMLIARESPVSAESLFVKARKKGAASPEFLLQYGLMLIDERRFAEAIAVLDSASKDRPGDGEILLALAEAQDRAGRYREAQDILEMLLARADDRGIAKRLAKVLFHKGDYEEALALCMTLEQTPEVMDRVAMCLHHLGRSDEALAWARKALASKPDWPQAMVNLSVILASRGELDEAASLLERALAREPDNVAAKINLERLKDAQRLRREQKKAQ